MQHNGADALNWMVCANDDLSLIAEAYDATESDERTQYGQVYFFRRTE